jgi:DNA-directed RNA polymerase specialized sigma24 family protein
MRWARWADMDVNEAPEAPFRDDHLRELVDQLPELQCELLSRHFFGGVSVAEAARELGLTTRQAREELTRALDHLRDLLSSE